MTEGVNAGDTVRVTNSIGRDWLHIRYCVGTAANPIRIVNYGGVVVIDASINTRTYCFNIDDCDHIIIDGWGHAKAWGFKLLGFSNTGLWLHDKTEHVEAFGVEIAYDNISDGGAGIRAGTRLNDAPPGRIDHDFTIRDCWIHDIFQESMYIGHTSTRSQYPIVGLTVQYNIITDCGWGGIQIRDATDVDCSRNEIDGCGKLVDENHAGGGLNVGVDRVDPMSGDWHSNTITNCERGIHQLTGDSDVKIHHNLIYHCGYGGPHGSQDGYKPQNGVDAGFKFYKNTIVDSAEYGIDTIGTSGEVEDCIVCGSGLDNINTSWTEDHNEEGTTASQNFEGTFWYHLTASSPAVGAAHDGSDCGWLDYN